MCPLLNAAAVVFLLSEIWKAKQEQVGAEIDIWKYTILSRANLPLGGCANPASKQCKSVREVM